MSGLKRLIVEVCRRSLRQVLAVHLRASYTVLHAVDLFIGHLGLRPRRRPVAGAEPAPARRAVQSLWCSLAATLTFAAAVPATAWAQEPIGDPYSQGLEILETGDWVGALRVWQGAREALSAADRSDPRMGIAYIETALKHGAVEYYETACEMYFWGLSGENLHEHAGAVRGEVERLIPLLLPPDEAAWRTDLEAGIDVVAERLRRYWLDRDPAPLTAINERLIEHWRRITYARDNFRRNESTVYGTDDRGLIYVKYGEPGMKRGGFLGASELDLRAWVVDPFARTQLRRLDTKPAYEVWVYDSLRPDQLTYFLFGNVGGTGRFALVGGVEDLINREAWSPGTRWYMPGGVRAFYYLQLFYYGELSAIGGPYQTRAEELNVLWGQAESRASSFGVGVPVPRESSLEAYDLRYREENRSDPAFHPLLAARHDAGLAASSNEFTLRTEFGLQNLEGDFPFRQQHPYRMNAAGDKFLDGAGAEIDYGPGVQLDALYTPANGDETSVTFQDKDYPPPTYNHIDRFFDPGDLLSFNAAATGRIGDTNYRASFTNLREKGFIPFHDGYTRRNARLDIDQQIWDNFTLSLSGYYAWARHDQLSYNTTLLDLSVMPPNVDLLARECLDPPGAAAEDCLEFGDLIVAPDPLNAETANPLYSQWYTSAEDKSSRALGSLFVRWSPTSWLDIEADFGLDRFDFEQVSQTRDAAFFSRQDNVSDYLNAGLTAAFHKQFGEVIGHARARYQLANYHSEWTEAAGSPPSTTGLGSVDIDSDLIHLVGAADYKGRYIVDGSIRREGSSWLPENRWSTYYRGSIAWRPSQEPWWFMEPLGELELRFSYSTAGQRPPLVEAFVVGPAPVDGLEPEVTREVEWALRMRAFNRLSLGLGHSDQKTDDVLLLVPQIRYGLEWENAGTIEGDTWELNVEAALAETQDLAWTARLTWERTRQVISELRVPPYRQDRFFWRAGEPLGAYWGNRWATSCADLNPLAQSACGAGEFQVNDDGYLVWVGGGNSYTDGIGKQLWGTTGVVNGLGYEFGMPIKALECERRLEDGHHINVPAIQCDADVDGVIDAPPAGFDLQRLEDFLRIGDTTPDFAWSLSTNLRWKGFTLYALFDSEIGHDVYFQTGQWPMRRLASGFVDQAGKSDAEKKPIKYYRTLFNSDEVNSFYVFDGSYVKLRELALGYSFNRDQVRSVFGFVGLQGATIRLVGRNLLTVTDYPGYDPEFGEGTGGSNIASRTDAYYYPNLRTLTAVLELTF